jgi:hypothetical protein
MRQPVPLSQAIISPLAGFTLITAAPRMVHRKDRASELELPQSGVSFWERV